MMISRLADTTTSATLPVTPGTASEVYETEIALRFWSKLILLTRARVMTTKFERDLALLRKNCEVDRCPSR